MLDKSSSNIGPSIFLGGSSCLKHSCIAMQGLIKILKSTFILDNSSKSISNVSLPHTAYPDSAIILGDMSSQASEMILCCSLGSGGEGGNLEIFFIFICFMTTARCAFLYYSLFFS